MGESRGKKDDVEKALAAIQKIVGSWAYTTIEAEVRRLRAKEETDTALHQAAVVEIVRLVGVLFQTSGWCFDETSWCEHGPAPEVRLKLECTECLAEIIAGGAPSGAPH